MKKWFILGNSFQKRLQKIIPTIEGKKSVLQPIFSHNVLTKVRIEYEDWGEKSVLMRNYDKKM